MRDGHEDRPESYDELLEGLRREVTGSKGLTRLLENARRNQMITTSSENLEPKRIMREHVGTAMR